MQLGMGWLGWTEEQTERSTFQAIQLAYEGRMDMLKAIFGGGDGDEKGSDSNLAKMKMQPATPERFRAALDFIGGKQMKVETWPKKQLQALASESTRRRSNKPSGNSTT